MHKKLGEILVDKGLLTEAQVREALETQRVTKEYLGTIFVHKKMIGEQDLMKALSEQFNIPLISLNNVPVDWDLCVSYYRKVPLGQKALPIHQDEDNVIVAIRDPLDMIALSSIEQSIRPKKIRLVLVCESELEAFIEECRRRSRSSIRELLDGEPDRGG